MGKQFYVDPGSQTYGRRIWISADELGQLPFAQWQRVTDALKSICIWGNWDKAHGPMRGYEIKGDQLMKADDRAQFAAVQRLLSEAGFERVELPPTC